MPSDGATLRFESPRDRLDDALRAIDARMAAYEAAQAARPRPAAVESARWSLDHSRSEMRAAIARYREQAAWLKRVGEYNPGVSAFYGSHRSILQLAYDHYRKTKGWAWAGLRRATAPERGVAA